jgi:hypothetical protein
MSIQKLRSGRVPTASASTYVGEGGTIFWNTSTGELRLSDGSTPGGLPIVLSFATATHAGAIKPGPGFTIDTNGLLGLKAGPSFYLDETNTFRLRPGTLTQIGGIKPGPGVTIDSEGTLLIDTAGLPFSFGDFTATILGNGDAALNSVNADQNIDIVSNGTGMINVVGEFHVHATNASVLDALAIEPIFKVSADGQIRMLVPLADSTTGALEIIGNDTGLFYPPNQTGVILHVTGNSGLVARNYFDANQNYALLVGRRYNGTQLAPTKVLNGELMFRIAGQGSTDGGFELFGPAQIDWVATEDQAPGHQGGELRIRATPNGSSAVAGIVQVAAFNATTGVTAIKFNGPLTGNVTGNVSGTAGSVAAANITGTTLASNVVTSSLTSVGTLTNLAIATGGTITAPRMVVNDGGLRTVNGGTTLTIDFAADTFILWTAPSGTAAITLSNYTAGARVKLMIAMTTSRDVTYGISSAANSSTGANNFNGAGAGSTDISNTTMFLDYVCMSDVAGGCYLAVTVN